VWADNETRIDLLGFDYLIDSLEIVLTEPRLLPVTVGVLGDWGSGKSSLLTMVTDRLAESGEYVVVPLAAAEVSSDLATTIDSNGAPDAAISAAVAAVERGA
jgi:KAP family P-loop domain.